MKTDLLQRLAQGDEVAFRCIYDRYATGLRYFAMRYISDHAPSEDIVQDAFISLWKKRKDFEKESSVRAYLYRTVQHSCLNALRHSKIERKYVDSHMGEDEISTFLDKVFEAEVFQEVAEAFAELTPAAKKVYELSLKGIKQDEIAQLLNITINTVKKHKNVANKSMRIKLKNKL